MIEILLKAGADPKANLPGGQTLLMTAARTGNPDVVRILLDRGGDPNAERTTQRETALMWAAAENHPEAAKAADCAWSGPQRPVESAGIQDGPIWSRRRVDDSSRAEIGRR